MAIPTRAPLQTCPICKIAMVAAKSADDLADFDTFSCLQCGSVVELSSRLDKDIKQTKK